MVSHENDVSPSSTSGRNAFDVLLASQAALSQPGRPAVVEVRNAKDNLYNAILECLAEQELDWRSDEIDTQGKVCVCKLTEVLWTLDGHHDVLSKQCCHVPPTFHRFQGYNDPTKHRHRKRVLSNLDGDLVHNHSSSLFDLLHAPFWSRRKWQGFRKDVELLARSMHCYGEYLKRQCTGCKDLLGVHKYGKIFK